MRVTKIHSMYNKFSITPTIRYGSEISTLILPLHTTLNKTGLQPVSRPVGQILGFYPKGFSAKRCLKFFFKPTGAKSLKGAGPSAPPNLFPNGEVFGRFVGKTSLTKNVEMISGVGGRGGGTKIL